MFRLLITFSKSFAVGAAVATTTLVEFETKAEADKVCQDSNFKVSYSVLKMYESDSSD